jgi:beta-lactamase regulating signal transducer with metallopeptidase domain
MNLLAHLLSPETMRIVALTLLHFVWQGAALAAAAYVSLHFLRSSSARYAFLVGVLVLMLAAPVATFVVLNSQATATASTSSGALNSALTTDTSTHAVAVKHQSTAAAKTAPDYFFLLVELWFAGVVLFSLRSAGGFFLVVRLRRKESTPVSREFLELCQALQQKMGITRMVRYCESLQLDAPVVVGWIRPVVLLPVSALTGLHELAHIQRLDAFVNLFQIAVESLLFYHPAVWWLGKRIREERENCCDDAAVAVCGSPVTYAHALARMAESRVAPQLLMAANRGPLAARVARILGIDHSSGAQRGANLSVGVLCLSAALLAGSALIGAAHVVRAQTPPAVHEAPAPAAPAPGAVVALRAPMSPVMVNVPVSIHLPATLAPAAPMPKAAAAPIVTVTPVAPAVRVTPYLALAAQAAAQPTAQSYIDGMKSAGLGDLSVDQLIALKVQGVTPEYVKQMHDIGLHPDADELVGMKVQGITPDYVREMRTATGQPLDIDNLIGLKVQGVTPEYIKQMHDLGIKSDADEIIGMKVQGITPDYVKGINALGFHPSADELIGMKVQGVNADYLKGPPASK